MPATTWQPYVDPYLPQFLITSNEVSCKMPELEISGSGRRCRFTGVTKSFAASELRQQLAQWATDQATNLSSTPWLYKWSDDVEKAYQGRQFTEENLATPARLHLLEPDTSRSSRGTTTSAVWRFQHPTLPITADVVVSLTSTYYGINLSSQVQYRNTVWQAGASLPEYVASYDEWDVPYVVDRPAAAALLEAGAKNKITFESRTFDKNAFRSATKKFLEACQAANDLTALDIPDWRDPKAPAWLTLDLATTNYSNEFEQSLKMYLDTEETAKALKQQIAEVVKTLRALGTVVTLQEDQDTAYAAAAMGELHRVTGSLDQAGQHDGAHQVLINLIDGTVRVACGKGEARGEAANAYEIAKFKAEITGQLEQFTQFVDSEAVNLEAEKIQREYSGQV